MKIAVIGSGISGLGAAYALSDIADVTVFEKDNRFGGHANTVDVPHADGHVAVDTGFIVYNTTNYPNLTSLFAHLDVPTKWSDMSFGLSVRGGAMEYACDSLDHLFAQRRNALRPSFVKGMLEILRFNRIGLDLLESHQLDDLSLGNFIEKHKFSNWFRDCFIVPFGGAIWSTPAGEVLDFPANQFVAFFRNHGLMSGLKGAPIRWRTVDGGSREYVDRLIARLGPDLHCNTPVVEVTRTGGKPRVRLQDGSEAVFDQVIMAGHAPQSMSLLSDADVQEREILGTFRTTRNQAVLHSDPALMPKRRKVWSAWNFLSGGFEDDKTRQTPVTYWMQRLQGLTPDCPLFVSLNPRQMPQEDLIHATFDYAHPYYDQATFAAQKDMELIQGRGGVWYAGAWLGFGFHEDGLRSGLQVAASLGAKPAWAAALPAPLRTTLAAAAE